MKGDLEIVAVVDTLTESVKRVPLLVGAPLETSALASESPMESIDFGGAEDGGVTDNETFAVVGDDLLRG